MVVKHPNKRLSWWSWLRYYRARPLRELVSRHPRWSAALEHRMDELELWDELFDWAQHGDRTRNFSLLMGTEPSFRWACGSELVWAVRHGRSVFFGALSPYETAFYSARGACGDDAFSFLSWLHAVVLANYIRDECKMFRWHGTKKMGGGLDGVGDFTYQ